MGKEIFLAVVGMPVGELLKGNFPEDVKRFFEENPDLTLQDLLGATQQQSFKELIDYVRKAQVESTYQKTKSWVVTAKRLGVSRVTVFNWKRKLKID